ncbi:MAG TPA: cation-transporting P-type ATPase [Micromonosporaceae bacterium]
MAPGRTEVSAGALVPTSVTDLAPDAALTALGSSPRGLTSAEWRRRVDRYGANELPRARRRRPLRRLAAQFTDLFAIVLLVAAGITFLAYVLSSPRDVGTLELGIAILAVVLLNAVIGFGQEYSAERTAEALQAMVPHTCRVLRDGERREVPVRDLAPGDLVVLEAGDAVPADCRLVDAHELAVDNAALTGESAPVRRRAEPVSADTPPVQAANRVFMGTSVAAGAGKALVLATGTGTEFGRIYQLAARAPQPRSPLQRQVAVLARRVAAIALVIGAVMFAVRLPAGAWVSAFVFALGVMVALVPEGLPATLSVSLAIGVRRMARRHALVKRLLAVEALGSTTVICTDKTGTLTKAEMTVTTVWVPDAGSGSPGTGHPVTGVGYQPAGEVADPAPVRPLLRAAALCSDARLVPPRNSDGWRVLGDTTEGALLVAAGKAGLSPSAEDAATPRVGEFPFDSARKLMTTVHRVPGGYACYVKGAPGELLARCTEVDTGGGREPLDDATRARLTAVADDLAASGLRVLGVAWRPLADPRIGQEQAESRLALLGFVGMVDPPRPEVAAAVDACHRAGIRIVMVTGDHPLTAEAVARRVGILPPGAQPVPEVVVGTTLRTLSDADLDGLLAAPVPPLFCRVAPEDKMRIVDRLERRGEVVAVTGDGANDAPALKRADIGVAMGVSGTDVARQAAVMVLLDDSFASVSAAVELGRTVYRNIRKFLGYVFTSNVGELVPVLVATFVGFPLVPLLAVQVLAVDLGSDVMPALALGAEAPEPDVMDQPPRSPTERLFSRGLLGKVLFYGAIQSAGVCLAFFWKINSAGIPYSAFTADNPVYREAVTMTQAGIVISQFFASFGFRTERESLLRVGPLSNPALLVAGLFGLGAMTAISYWPPLQAVFHTAPLTGLDWAVLVAFGVVLLLADEGRKALLRRHDNAKAKEVALP